MSCTLSHRHCGDLAGDRQRRGGEHYHFVPARVTYGAMEVHLLNKFLCLKRDEWAWDKKRSLDPCGPEQVDFSLRRDSTLSFPSVTQQPKVFPLLKPFLFS